MRENCAYGEIRLRPVGTVRGSGLPKDWSELGSEAGLGSSERSLRGRPVGVSSSCERMNLELPSALPGGTCRVFGAFMRSRAPVVPPSAGGLSGKLPGGGAAFLLGDAAAGRRSAGG
eukprot:CAMPEP_0171069636 /NCGR_PEP_ID=MMETSP0766_2-20121228/9271_1 /TAXON_ID=439317 /ORGANISM="Gambierdiscus australes, Strain CAWD 149" /LENGTH=116 /DNA_ID=CAMNT_0011526039 /DNA_START=91 /DNA_END=437 /DNA_ORIENTATION=+